MRGLVLLILFCDISLIAFAQEADTLPVKPDSLSKIDKTQFYSTAPENMRITFPSYFILLGDDLKQDITAPFHQTKKNWQKIGIYTASIAVLTVVADEPIQRSASTLYNHNKVVADVSDYITHLGGRYELYSLAALGGYGFVFNNKKLQTTTLIATQAYITSGLIETAIKAISGRQRPSYKNPDHPEPEPTFHGPFYKKGIDVSGDAVNSSFPSGHATVIFAAATVFATQYKNVPWVPVVAYSTASLVGISRITENKHWFTDVVVGATLGYLCGKQAVNSYHRYAEKKSSLHRGRISFNINYNGNNLEPGFIYTFR